MLMRQLPSHAESTYGANSETEWTVYFSDGRSHNGKIRPLGDFCFSLSVNGGAPFYVSPVYVTRLIPIIPPTD